MGGLMSDPQGQIIDLPIQSNLLEGLAGDGNKEFQSLTLYVMYHVSQEKDTWRSNM
jgi:hypothetical protein